VTPLELSRDDCIYVGIGSLYGAPFLCSHLIYRLFDLNCALLIYHEAVSGGATVNSCDNVSLIATSVRPVTSIHVHCSFKSASADFADLLNLPSTRVSLTANNPATADFNDLSIQIEPFVLPFTEKLIMACEPFPPREFRIAQSAFHVNGPLDVSSWPAKVQAGNLKQRCWKLLVNFTKHKTSYNLKSECDWSLTALDVDECSRPTLEVTLRKVIAK
jgi:hypothetical protein